MFAVPFAHAISSSLSGCHALLHNLKTDFRYSQQKPDVTTRDAKVGRLSSGASPRFDAAKASSSRHSFGSSGKHSCWDASKELKTGSGWFRIEFGGPDPLIDDEVSLFIQISHTTMVPPRHFRNQHALRARRRSRGDGPATQRDLRLEGRRDGFALHRSRRPEALGASSDESKGRKRMKPPTEAAYSSFLRSREKSPRSLH